MISQKKVEAELQKIRQEIEKETAPIRARIKEIEQRWDAMLEEAKAD